MARFKIGEIYTRSKIHDRYGGQRQVGISVLKGYPMIFLFAGMSGNNTAMKTDFSLMVRFGTTDKDGAAI